MNILVERLTGLIKYQGYDFVFVDNHTVQLILDEHIELIDCSLNRENSDVYQIDKIEDFVGDKFKYENGVVSISNDWVDETEEL